MPTYDEFKKLVWKEFLAMFEYGDEAAAKKYFERVDVQEMIAGNYQEFCAKIKDHRSTLNVMLSYWPKTCAYNLELLY